MPEHEATHSYPAGYTPIPGEEGVHKGVSYKTGQFKGATAGHASGGGGAAHGFGHSGGQKHGPLRMSGHKSAHRVGGRKK